MSDINRVNIDAELIKLAKKISRGNGFSSDKQMNDFYFNIFKTFIYHNAKNTKDKEVLLEVLKNTQTFFQKDINKYLEKVMFDINELYLNESIFLIRGADFSNSTNALLSIMNASGNPTDIIYLQKCGKLSSEEKKHRTLIYIDDFVGVGQQIKEQLVLINDVFENSTIYVYCYIWLEEGKKEIDSFLQGVWNNNFVIRYKHRREKIVKDFTKSIKSKKLIDEIIALCNQCASVEYALGRGEAKALITINNQSPNNNLSITWRNDIAHSEDSQWFPFAPRSMNQNYYKSEVIRLLRDKKQLIIFEKYLKDSKINITLSQFKLCILAMNIPYLDLVELKKSLGYNTQESFDKDLNELYENSIINLKKQPYRFSDKIIYNQMNGINKTLYRKITTKAKQRNHKFGKLS